MVDHFITCFPFPIFDSRDSALTPLVFPLFLSFCVLMCGPFFKAGMKGMGCPPLSEMKMVVLSAGGTWLPRLPAVSPKILALDACLAVDAHPLKYGSEGSQSVNRYC